MVKRWVNLAAYLILPTTSPDRAGWPMVRPSAGILAARAGVGDLAQLHSVKYPGLRKTAMFRGPLDPIVPVEEARVLQPHDPDLEFLLGGAEVSVELPRKDGLPDPSNSVFLWRALGLVAALRMATWSGVRPSVLVQHPAPDPITVSSNTAIMSSFLTTWSLT